MLPVSHSSVLLDLLYTQAREFVGIYDLTAGWFTHVNPAGLHLLGYPSEATFLAEPLRTLRTEPWTDAQWQDMLAQVRTQGRLELETEIRRREGAGRPAGPCGKRYRPGA